MAKTARAELSQKKVDQTKKRKPVTLYERSKKSKNSKEVRAIVQAQAARKKAKTASSKEVKECFGTDSEKDDSEEEEDDDDDEEEEEEEEEEAAGTADQPLDIARLMENPQQMAALFAMLQKVQGGQGVKEEVVVRRPAGATDDEVSAMQADARVIINDWERAKKLPKGACKEDLGKKFLKLKKEIGKKHVPPCSERQVHTYLVAHLSYRKARRGGTGRFKMNRDGDIRIYGGPLNGLTVEGYEGTKVPNADIVKKLVKYTDPASREGEDWTTLQEAVGGSIVWPVDDESEEEEEEQDGEGNGKKTAPQEGGEQQKAAAGEVRKLFD